MHRCNKLKLIDELLLVLTKLRLKNQTEDLTYRFGVPPLTVLRTFHQWLDECTPDLGSALVA